MPTAPFALTLCVAALVASGSTAPKKWTIETVAGSGQKELGPAAGPAREVAIGQPFGVVIGPDGALYVCEVENHRVLRIDLKGGRVALVAGCGRRGGAGDGGPAQEAELDEPYEVRFDGEQAMYVVEMRGARVRRVDLATHRIERVAGTGEVGFGGDGGPAREARLDQPHSIVLDGRGGLLIADIGNHRIRRVDLASGVIDTIAGNGERKPPVEGAIAKGQPLLGPRALHVRGDTLWIALREGHSVWRMGLDTGLLRHVAGSGERGWKDGMGREARFDGPKGIVAAPDGVVYVADTENQVIRRVDPLTGSVETVAGGGPETRGFGGDGGDALGGKMDRPHGITVDAHGRVYVGDTNNHRIRRVAPESSGKP